MCFSAIVSFGAAAALSLVGTLTIGKATSSREILLAAFPGLFAIQQTCEGLVWLSQDNSNLSGLDPIGTYGFLLFATLLWLILSPLSIYSLERDVNRCRVLLGLTVCGLLLGIYLFGWSIYFGVDPQTFSGNLFYDLRFIPGYEVCKYLYLAIICLPFAIARSSALNLFGGAIVLSFVAAQLFFQMTLVSVWCFFAAILSGFLHLAIERHHTNFALSNENGERNLS
jgi:hypothetical protein